MCFEFGCFGGGRTQDCGGERPSREEPEPHGGGRGRRGNRRNGGHQRGAADHKPPPAAYPNQPHAAVEEAGHKAYHDGARKDHHAAAGGHGGYAAYVVQDKAEYDTPKLPAWHNKVGNDAGYTYTARLPEAAADRRENAAMDYRHYPATTTNTTLERY